MKYSAIFHFSTVHATSTSESPGSHHTAVGTRWCAKLLQTSLTHTTTTTCATAGASRQQRLLPGNSLGDTK